MQKTALVILAAGIGSRFGKGVKQLTSVGPSGELIIDYSIHDALEAGFDQVVFIIRRDLEQDVKDIIGRRVEKLCEVKYVYQELDELPAGFTITEGRKKPWGTGQALLMCRGVVDLPFLVINADDYYGKEAFLKTHDFLLEHASDHRQYCMAGFVLKNTLSENGGVTRGICEVGPGNFLTNIVETFNIVRSSKGARSEDTGKQIDLDSYVSMNMWGMTPEFLDDLEDGFAGFLAGLKPGDTDSEYLLPDIIGDMLRSQTIQVTLLTTHDKWFGVTYASDREPVRKEFSRLVEEGIYTSPLEYL